MLNDELLNLTLHQTKMGYRVFAQLLETQSRPRLIQPMLLTFWEFLSFILIFSSTSQILLFELIFYNYGFKSSIL